jgi:hypothetical protein
MKEEEENVGAALIARRWDKPDARAAQAEKMRRYWAGMTIKQRRKRLSNLLETSKQRKGKRGKNGRARTRSTE